jgi:hypothetical protein
MGRTCGTYGGKESCIQGFGGETCERLDWGAWTGSIWLRTFSFQMSPRTTQHCVAGNMLSFPVSPRTTQHCVAGNILSFPVSPRTTQHCVAGNLLSFPVSPRTTQHCVAGNMLSASCGLSGRCGITKAWIFTSLGSYPTECRGTVLDYLAIPAATVAQLHMWLKSMTMLLQLKLFCSWIKEWQISRYFTP